MTYLVASRVLHLIVDIEFNTSYIMALWHNYYFILLVAYEGDSFDRHISCY